MDYGHRKADEELKKLEKRIQEEYKKAAEEVQDSLEKYLKNYYHNDAVMRLKLDAEEITEAAYLEWKQKQILINSKWVSMRDDLTQTYLNADKVAQKMILEHRMDMYALNFNYGTFEAEMLSGINTSFTLYNRDTVMRLMMDNPKLLPEYTQKVKGSNVKKLKRYDRNYQCALKRGKLKRWNEEQLQSVTTQKILQGKPIREMAKDIAIAVGTSNMYQAIRAARTMTTSAENAGRLDSYRRAGEHGIEINKVWTTRHDERVRKSHRELEGEMVALEDTFSNGLMYPADPDGEASEVYNCRCTLTRKLMSVNGVDVSDVMETDYEWDGDFDAWVADHY